MEYRVHLGGGVYCSVTTHVDIRRYFMKSDNTLQATKEWVSLRISEWADLVKDMDKIKNADDELARAIPCYEEPSHMNQISVLSCRECHPFTYNDPFLNY